MDSNDTRTLFTTAEAAQQLGMTQIGVHSAIRRGTLPAVRIHARLTMVTQEAIDAYRRDYLGKRGGYRPRKNSAANTSAQPAKTTAE